MGDGEVMESEAEEGGGPSAEGAQASGMRGKTGRGAKLWGRDPDPAGRTSMDTMGGV